MMCKIGDKTRRLLDALGDGPLTKRECNEIARNRIPWLIEHNLAAFVGCWRNGIYYAATDLGMKY